MAGPSPALQQVVDASPLWRTLQHHEQVGSTNELALEAVRDGDAVGQVVTADRQTAGRGRRGRTWQDHPDGASLAVSVTIATPVADAALVPLAAGVALGDALRKLGLRVALKWPNDVLLELPGEDGGRRKVAGILVEAVSDGIVVGAGINIDFRGLEPVEDATSVAEVLGRDVDRWVLLANYLRALQAWLEELDTAGPERLLDGYRQRCATLGQQVTATVANGPVEGRATQVAADGALVVQTEQGPVRVSSGEVVHVR